MKWFFQVLILLTLNATASAAQPASIQASYEVFMSGMKVGKIEETYTRVANDYTLNSVTTPLGLLAMFKPEKVFLSSQGMITKQGLRPDYFEDKREGNPAKSSQARFDWPAKKLTLIRQTLRTPLDLPEGTQDRLSAMYQFMYINLKNIDTLDFFMTNGSKLDNYHYTVGVREKLDTPAGQFDSIYLETQNKPGESRTEIWLSAENNLPCKMLITDAHGDQYTQILSGLKITP